MKKYIYIGLIPKIVIPSSAKKIRINYRDRDFESPFYRESTLFYSRSNIEESKKYYSRVEKTIIFDNYQKSILLNDKLALKSFLHKLSHKRQKVKVSPNTYTLHRRVEFKEKIIDIPLNDSFTIILRNNNIFNNVFYYRAGREEEIAEEIFNYCTANKEK